MRSHVRILLVLSLAVAATIPVTGQAFAVRSHHDPGPAGQDAVLAWNATATSAAVACGFTPDGNPPYESRLYAMTHIAIYDALNEIRPVYRPYTYDPPGSQPHASADAAVAAAANGVLAPGLAAVAPGVHVNTGRGYLPGPARRNRRRACQNRGNRHRRGRRRGDQRGPGPGPDRHRRPAG